MITEEMLISAAGEVSAAIVGSLSEEPHQFSPMFERKLRALIHRAEHPVRYRVLRQAAAVLIVAISIFSVLYLTVPTVRAATDHWIKTTFGRYIQYYPEEVIIPEVQYDYYLPNEFDGYTLIDVVDEDTETMYIYRNESGQFLFFDYYRSASNSSTFLMGIEDYQHIAGFVDSVPADIYIAPTEQDSSCIIWTNPTDGVLLCIQACEDAEQLVAIAEKIKKSEIISE